MSPPTSPAGPPALLVLENPKLSVIDRGLVTRLLCPSQPGSTLKFSVTVAAQAAEPSKRTPAAASSAAAQMLRTIAGLFTSRDEPLMEVSLPKRDLKMCTAPPRARRRRSTVKLSVTQYIVGANDRNRRTRSPGLLFWIGFGRSG